MKNKLPLLTQDLIDAFAASAGLWLARLIGVLMNPRAANRRRLLTRLVQFGERWVEHIIFCMAGHRLGPPKRRAKWLICSRPGFRVSRGTNRLLWKSARIRLRQATLIARATRLIEALADPERYCVHYMKKLARGLCFRRLAPCAPPAVAFTSAAPADVSVIDSS